MYRNRYRSDSNVKCHNFWMRWSIHFKFGKMTCCIIFHEMELYICTWRPVWKQNVSEWSRTRFHLCFFICLSTIYLGKLSPDFREILGLWGRKQLVTFWGASESRRWPRFPVCFLLSIHTKSQKVSDEFECYLRKMRALCQEGIGIILRRINVTKPIHDYLFIFCLSVGKTFLNVINKF